MSVLLPAGVVHEAVKARAGLQLVPAQLRRALGEASLASFLEDPLPDPGSIEDRPVVRVSRHLALADLAPLQELGFHVDLGVQPAQLRQFGLGHVEQAEQLRDGGTVELHPGPPGTGGVNTPRVATTARRGIHCLLPGKRPTQRAASVSSARPCVRASLLPERSRGLGPELLYPPGPLTVSTNSLDSILPSLVQIAPLPSPSSIPATGPPVCRCGTSGNARWSRAR